MGDGTMKAFLIGVVAAIGIAVVAAWVLQDYVAESSARAYSTGSTRID
jgi:heme/copper-type cytochrome/quinol oxidase subunit 4